MKNIVFTYPPTSVAPYPSDTLHSIKHFLINFKTSGAVGAPPVTISRNLKPKH